MTEFEENQMEMKFPTPEGSLGMTAPSDPFDSIGDLESDVSSMDTEQIDEFSESALSMFDKVIVLTKRDAANFVRVVEPLVKSSVDEYGKSLNIRCLDKDTIELRYVNGKYTARMKAINKSGKVVKAFSLSVAILKRLVTQSYASIVLVEKDDEMHLALCQSLVYLETKTLTEEQFVVEQKATTKLMDKTLASYAFRKLGTILNTSDRASEKIIVIYNNFASYNTGIVAAKIDSPFKNTDDFIIYKVVSESLGILTDITKTDLTFDLHGDILAVNCDGVIYVEYPISVGEKVKEFYSPVAENSLKFKADISLANDSILRIITVVKSLEYLNNIVSIHFPSREEMVLQVFSQNFSKISSFEFKIIEGVPEILTPIKINVDVLKTFLDLGGSSLKYCRTNDGLGITNDYGTFLLRQN